MRDGEQSRWTARPCAEHAPSAGVAGSGQVLLAVEVAGVNRAGLLLLPVVPGFEGAGRVLAVGAGVDRFGRVTGC